MEHNHTVKLEEVKKGMPSAGMLNGLAYLFKVFGDYTRIKILYALFESELCVCAIADLVDMSQSAVSHSLKILKDNNLIASRREGKTIYYRLSDDHVRTIIGMGYEHLIEKGEN